METRSLPETIRTIIARGLRTGGVDAFWGSIGASTGHRRMSKCGFVDLVIGKLGLAIVDVRRLAPLRVGALTPQATLCYP